MTHCFPHLHLVECVEVKRPVSPQHPPSLTRCLIKLCHCDRSRLQLSLKLGSGHWVRVGGGCVCGSGSWGEQGISLAATEASANQIGAG